MSDLSNAARRRFKMSYVIAFTAIAIVSVAGHLVTAALIAENRNDARIIDTAGFQRTLLTQISALTFALQSDELRTPERLDRLNSSIKSFQSTQDEINELLIRDSIINTQPIVARNDQFDFEEFNKIIDEILAIAEEARVGPIETQKGRYMEQAVYGLLLDDLNYIVQSIAIDVQNRHELILLLQIVKIFIIVTIILLELIFIFWPLMSRLIYALERLERAKVEATDALNARSRFMAEMKVQFIDRLSKAEKLLNDGSQDAALSEIKHLRNYATVSVEFFDNWQNSRDDDDLKMLAYPSDSRR